MRGKPSVIVGNNGTELTSNAVLEWCGGTKIDWQGKPIHNAFVESFKGRMRHELLNEALFTSLDHAPEKVAVWAWDYKPGAPLLAWLQRPSSVRR